MRTTIAVTLPSGETRSLALAALSAEVESLAKASAALGCELELSVKINVPDINGRRAMRAPARPARDAIVPTAEKTTTKARARRLEPSGIDRDHLRRAAAKDGFSPSAYARRWGHKVGNVTYHLRRIREAGKKAGKK